MKTPLAKGCGARRGGISQTGDIPGSNGGMVAETTLIGTESRACSSSRETEAPSINKHFLSTYYVPCTVLGARNRAADKTDKLSAL